MNCNQIYIDLNAFSGLHPQDIVKSQILIDIEHTTLVLLQKCVPFTIHHYCKDVAYLQTHHPCKGAIHSKHTNSAKSWNPSTSSHCKTSLQVYQDNDEHSKLILDKTLTSTVDPNR